MARYLTQKYDGSVNTSFYDLANPNTRSAHPDLAKEVDANRWNLPLVAIDDKILFSGYVDHRAIVKYIEAKRVQSS
ncbi:MAG: DUF1462 family protein [Chloroflexi bacterium]|nr:DUF1462 family protein [Chloroflexota bacterium]MCL5110106.1 DUF1462 family protein [Chloroflexota bacterium]